MSPIRAGSASGRTASSKGTWKAQVRRQSATSVPLPGGSGSPDRLVTSQVTHVDPPHSWGVRGIDGPIRAAVDVTVEPLENDRRSRVTITIDFTGYGIGKLLVPLLVRPQARREMPANVQRLKERLESLDHPING